MEGNNPYSLYRTSFGEAFVGDSIQLLERIPSNSIDLVVTSPPFALQRPKAYGNKDQQEYVDWLLGFGCEVFRVLKETGSFVLDLGGAYQKGRPVRSLYNFRVLLRLCDEGGFNLAEEFFWYNPAKLPSPIEWVNKRKVRVKDAVNTVWWLSKSDFPKANVRNVLVPYSKRMKSLLENPEGFYKPKKRPSGHDISAGFGNENGGAIPSNLLEIPDSDTDNLLKISNTESNSKYMRLCIALGATRHPARFPLKLPLFFIDFLTEPGDTVLDIFAGSNTTGEAAESRRRRWIACDVDRSYVAASAFRFFQEPIHDVYKLAYRTLLEGEGLPVELPDPEQLVLIR